MEQQGEGLEVWSDAAGEDADAVAWDEGEDAVAWDEGEGAWRGTRERVTPWIRMGRGSGPQPVSHGLTPRWQGWTSSRGAR